MYGLAATGVSLVVYGVAAVVATGLGVYAKVKSRRGQ